MRNAEGGVIGLKRESTKIDLDRLSSEIVRLEETYDFLEYAEVSWCSYMCIWIVGSLGGC